MQPILDFFSHNLVVLGMLVMAIIDSIVSAHPGTPADSVLEMIKNGIQALLGNAPKA